MLKKTILAASLAAASPAYASETGVATWYENPWHHGLVAAHKTFPFGSHVRVTNLDNGRSLIVTIVDRGPFARGRIIDVSPVAATQLGFLKLGIAHVKLEKV